jgi:hypothetical protein
LWQLILALYADGLVWVDKLGVDLISDALLWSVVATRQNRF